MKYDRDDLHEMFRLITNIVQPEHPYSHEYAEMNDVWSKDIYPIREDELKTSWKRCDSRSWAACGPRYTNGNKAFIAFDLQYMNNCSIERALCIINHELSHITEGSHTEGSAHNPAFWNEVIRNAKIIIDNKAEVEEIIGEAFNTEEFIEEVVEEPNNSMTDGRIETKEERREKMREQLEGYGVSEYTEEEKAKDLETLFG